MKLKSILLTLTTLAAFSLTSIASAKHYQFYYSDGDSYSMRVPNYHAKGNRWFCTLGGVTAGSNSIDYARQRVYDKCYKHYRKAPYSRRVQACQNNFIQCYVRH